MRKTVRILLLGALVAVVLCGSAMAADSTGVYNVTGVTPQDANQNEIAAAPGTVNGSTVDGFYAGAVRFALPLSGATEDQYLVFVLEGDGATTEPTATNIVYIDQKAGTEASAFDLYPSRLTTGKIYTVCVSSTDTGIRIVGSFQYYAPYTLGNVNGDRFINSKDAQLVLQYYAKKYTLEGNDLLAANVNGDKFVNSKDANLILLYYAKKISSFPGN